MLSSVINNLVGIFRLGSWDCMACIANSDKNEWALFTYPAVKLVAFCHNWSHQWPDHSYVHLVKYIGKAEPSQLELQSLLEKQWKCINYLASTIKSRVCRLPKAYNLYFAQVGQRSTYLFTTIKNMFYLNWNQLKVIQLRLPPMSVNCLWTPLETANLCVKVTNTINL